MRPVEAVEDATQAVDVSDRMRTGRMSLYLPVAMKEQLDQRVGVVE